MKKFYGEQSSQEEKLNFENAEILVKIILLDTYCFVFTVFFENILIQGKEIYIR